MKTGILSGLILITVSAAIAATSPREEMSLSGEGWEFFGASEKAELPAIDSGKFKAASWQAVRVPHVFQTRQQFTNFTQGWYRRSIAMPSNAAGRRFYLVFEGAAAIADVHVNGNHLGQHRGAYTRFLFDATDALRPGSENSLALKVDVSPSNMADCLPSSNRLYTVWGGLYRKVWLVSTDPLHIDPTDFASPGVYITPRNVSASSADLSIQVLVRNALDRDEEASVRAVLLDPAGAVVKTFTDRALFRAGQRTTVDLAGHVSNPKLWSPETPNLYQVRVEIVRGGKVVDAVTEPCGLRSILWKDGQFYLNGKLTKLAGGNLHQEIESKAAALDDEDIRHTFDLMKDMGANFVRLCHYPHARFAYELCDRMGLVCWAENGHSNRQRPTSTADQITREMVKQNYNHPSIAVWSVGNEASADTAEAMVPVVKSLDSTRPVAVANMTCTNADFHGENLYPAWYGNATNYWDIQRHGYITETGVGGVVTVHSDYATVRKRVDHYEPEEYQHLVAEARAQVAISENDGALGLFAWWCMRDFTDRKYKGTKGVVGWNTKGLLTYAGDKKDAYFLFRSLLRTNVPTVHIASKRYFLRTGSVTNGIKAYSNARHLTLTINGETIGRLENGRYRQPNGMKIDNVFFWPAPLRTGRNVVLVSDDAGNSDSAVIYFHGKDGLSALEEANALVRGLKSSNATNAAFHMDMPVQAQWPFYYELDSTADNSFDQLPAQLRGATWITTRRVTKRGYATTLEFTVTRPATVYLMRTAGSESSEQPPAAGFSKVTAPDLVWRDNDLMLVPAELWARSCAAGETLRMTLAERDSVILLKERE